MARSCLSLTWIANAFALSCRPHFWDFTEERERAFGRALGRVLVHELFHVFWSTEKHGTGGVAKEKYAVSDLLAEHFQFNEKQMRSLTAAKTLAALRASSKPLKASR